MSDAVSVHSSAKDAVGRAEAALKLGLYSPEVLVLAGRCYAKCYESYPEGMNNIAEARKWLAELEKAQSDFYLELVRMGKLDPNSDITISGIPIKDWLSNEGNTDPGATHRSCP